MTTPQSINAAAGSIGEVFGPQHMSNVVAQLETARVILRTVSLALRAEEDGKVSHSDKVGAARWSSATAAALVRLKGVRDLFNETSAAPALDWVTSLTLIDALDSALIEGYCSSGELLTPEETSLALGIIIDELDNLLGDCSNLSVTPLAQ